MTGAQPSEQRVDVGQCGRDVGFAVVVQGHRGQPNVFGGLVVVRTLGVLVARGARSGRVRELRRDRDVELLDLRGDLGRDIDRFVARGRSFDRGARLDLRECFGGVEERALDRAVRVEETVAPAAQGLDLRVQERAPTHQIAEHALARRLRFVEHLATLQASALDESLGAGLRLVERRRRACLRGRHEVGRLGLGFLSTRREQLRSLGARPLRGTRRFLDQLRRPVFGLLADVVARLARGAQQPGRLLAQGVEQLLFGERARRVNLFLERVDGRLELGFASASDRELLGHALQERSDLGLAEAAHTLRERTARDLVGR